MENNETKVVKVGSGCGFFTLLTIAFIVLKLCKVITWSWVWVLSPLWIGFAVTIVLVIIASIISLIASRWL